MLIPIGSWCRVAYQVNEFKKRLRVKPVAYPYDWTITPFSALKITLDKDFISENVLHQDNLVLSKFGSILDNYSQLIHLYDFNPQKLKELRKSGGFNENNIPVRLFKSELVDKAQARFRNAYNNLQSLKNNEKKLAFVRWNRFGHPDPHLPYAFKGESNSAIAEILSGYLNSSIMFNLPHLVNCYCLTSPFRLLSSAG